MTKSSSETSSCEEVMVNHIVYPPTRIVPKLGMTCLLGLEPCEWPRDSGSALASTRSPEPQG